MEFIKANDFALIIRNAGKDPDPVEHKKLKQVYLKLEHLCKKIASHGFEYSIRKDPRKQAGRGTFQFEHYHWAKIFPKGLKSEMKEKFAYIVVIADTLHFHMMGIGNYQNTEVSKEASLQSRTTIPIDGASYESVAQNFKEFDEKHRSLFISAGAELGIAACQKIKNQRVMNERRDLLKYKKQIILQGPPGTGKTREAKKLARELIAIADLSQVDHGEIRQCFRPGQVIPMKEGKSTFQIVEINQDEKFQLEVGEKKPYSVSVDQIVAADGERTYTGRSYAKAMADYAKKELFKKQVELVQFHPSYSYEDFVRGISASGDGEKVVYKTENRSLAAFAQKALKNLENTKKDTKQLAKENWIEQEWNEFLKSIEEKIANEGSYPLTPKVSVVAIEEDCLRYGGEAWKTLSRINFSDAKMLIEKNLNKPERKITIDKVDSSQAYYRSTYYSSLLKDFFKGRSFKEKQKSVSERLKNYVLIIDEINRANLPAVLGELIYALEYRGEPVQSMYGIGETNNREIILPENLYIIGTMNTADRSVGHIDYAIQRRFAFVEMLPRLLNDSELDNGDVFRPDEFNEVKKLFIDDEGKASKHLSTEFNERPQDVWIGHSYFIDKKEVDFKIRLKYEVAPILEEYVKDGILKNDEEVKRIIDKYKA